ncbi:hypothetical protein TCAL_03846 [Tigriopus californicus]|uniref:Fucosyltransferase n=2 Tax=Tigriopus californicus TaxID=6832 RepID=A0A553PI84_TIGCA|nr:hypothetical protein TCAL_03846 [Tigriopus californicus]
MCVWPSTSTDQSPTSSEYNVNSSHIIVITSRGGSTDAQVIHQISQIIERTRTLEHLGFCPYLKLCHFSTGVSLQSSASVILFLDQRLSSSLSASSLSTSSNLSWGFDQSGTNTSEQRQRSSTFWTTKPSTATNTDQRGKLLRPGSSSTPLRGLLVLEPFYDHPLDSANNEEHSKSFLEGPYNFTISYNPIATINLNEVIRLANTNDPTKGNSSILLQSTSTPLSISSQGVKAQQKGTLSPTNEGSTNNGNNRDHLSAIDNESQNLKRRASIATILDTCHTPSNREGYIQELSQYVTVDVYGKCGRPCPSSTREECLVYLERLNQYLFILVFEKHLCQHYQSELLWQVLELTTLIPITFSGVDHFHTLPKFSFIDALSQPPRALAQHIQFLEIQPQHLQRYQQWRQKILLAHVDWQCQLCRHLISGTLQSISEVSAPLLPQARCTKWPQLQFKRRRRKRWTREKKKV